MILSLRVSNFRGFVRETREFVLGRMAALGRGCVTSVIGSSGTESTNSFVEGTLSPKVSAIVRNKLYVALTRATDDLYIMPTEVYKKWKSRHIEILESQT